MKEKQWRLQENPLPKNPPAKQAQKKLSWDAEHTTLSKQGLVTPDLSLRMAGSSKSRRSELDDRGALAIGNAAGTMRGAFGLETRRNDQEKKREHGDD